MACPTSAQKIDSNFTGLRYSFEVCIGQLPGESGESHATTGLAIPVEEFGNDFPVWHVLEPNSYADFGAQISTVARTPINAARQREKGVATDLDASAGFQVDFTLDNLYRLMPTFFFAAWRRTAEFGRSSQDEDVSVDAASTALDGTNVTANFSDGGTNYSGDLIIIGRSVANSGVLFTVADATSNTNELVLTVAPTQETLIANAYVKKVGLIGDASDITVDATSTSTLPALVSTDLNFSSLSIIPGQWVFIGGDSTTNQFSSSGNNGFARVFSVATNRLEFDKTQNTMTNDNGTGRQVQIFTSDLIRNEPASADIKRSTVQMERSLSTAGYEYVLGCVANTIAFNIATADKITVDMTFVATDAVAQLARKSIANEEFPVIDTANVAFNTSSDFSRIRLATHGALQTPLFAFITDLTLTINNNLTSTKAVGTFGAFEVTAGDFTVDGTVTAYFSDVDAVAAVRNNTDVTFDFVVAQDNEGWVFDLPLVGLGDGRLAVEKDQPITIPLSLGAARHPTLLTTFIACYFPYLPNLAEA